MWQPKDPTQIIQDHIDRIPLKDLAKIHKGTKDQIRGYLQNEDRWIPYKRGKIDLPEKEIISLYKKDISIEGLAERYNVSVGPIISILTKNKCRKPAWLKHLKFSKIEKLLNKEYFIESVEECVGLHHLMRELDVGETLVRQLCKYHGVTLLNNSGLVRSMLNRRDRNAIPFTKDEFEKQHFKYNKSIQNIAELMGVSTGYLRQYVNKWNIKTRDTRISLKFRVFKRLPADEIQKLVNDIPLTKLHKDYEVSYDVFRNFLTEKHITIPTRFMSLGETSVGDFVESLNIKVDRNNRKLIYPYELDIYIPSHNLAIEYCGLYWHSELNNRGQNYHINKLNRCKKEGIRLLTIFEDEYINNPDLVHSKIQHIIGLPTKQKVNARSCIVREIVDREKREFLDKNHIQGNDRSRIKLGLFTKQNKIVAVMTFAKPSRARSSVKIMSRPNVWELNRFATDISCNVRGAAGKLLTHFKQNYSWAEIYSYADKRWSEGNLYHQLGFLHISDSPPNYWYVPKGYHQREYRYNYTKFKLVEQGFDESKTEKEIMLSRGYTRVWDCGHLKFEIKNPA